MMKTVVTIRNARGHALHCMLEQPASGAAPSQVAAVLLCPGVKTRVGPHRLNRKLARPFLERGIAVLRVDFAGLGDSEGELQNDALEHIYREIELGGHVGDARAALDWLESRFGIRRFIVGGLCGAAMTALHLALDDERLWALFAVGLPVRLDLRGTPVVTHGELQSHWSRYLLKLAQPSAWLRLLSLKSDYRLMWRAISQRLRKPKPSAHREPGAPASDLNPHLAPAMLALLETGRTALLLFGENDPRRWDFEEKFFQPWQTTLEPYRAQIAYSTIAGANHVLGAPAAVLEANRQTGAWLDALLATLQVADSSQNSNRAMRRSGRGADAIEVHGAAIECVVGPAKALSGQDLLCSTNEFSSSTRLRK